MKRVWVVGDSGSGKTTVARAIAARLGLPHVELDALMHRPGWREAPLPEFRAAVDAATSGDAWVVDGNYTTQVGDLREERADRVVWLDYPLHVCWPRTVRRSFRRAVDGAELWNGNRERFRLWLRPDHPIWYTLRTHRARGRQFESLMDDRWVRLHGPADVERWLAGLVDGGH